MGVGRLGARRGGAGPPAMGGHNVKISRLWGERCTLTAHIAHNVHPEEPESESCTLLRARRP
jgi:hypothetical protein